MSSRPECCLSHLCIPFLIIYATFYYADYPVASLFLLCTSQLFWLYVPFALFLCCTCSVPVVLPKHKVIQYTWHSYVLIVENDGFLCVSVCCLYTWNILCMSNNGPLPCICITSITSCMHPHLCLPAFHRFQPLP